MEEKPTYEMINKTWKKSALQDYLRKRNLKVSGSREELVARVFAAVEQNVDINSQIIRLFLVFTTMNKMYNSGASDGGSL